MIYSILWFQNMMWAFIQVRVYIKLLLASQAGVFHTKLFILTQLLDTDWSLLLGLNQNQGQYKVLREEPLSQAEKASFS